MSETIMVSVLSLIGTCVGALAGILTANKMTIYRIEQLEQKVDKHNTMIERTYRLEGQMVECQHDIRELKKAK